MKTRARFYSITYPAGKIFMILSLGYAFSALISCSSSKGAAKTGDAIMDPVCNMKIADKSEAYSWKYKEKVYYFDSNTCKETFKMNPEKFIQNACNQVK